MENKRLEREKFLTNYYVNEIKRDNIDEVFSDIDRCDNIDHDFIERIADRFNNVFRPEYNAKLPSQYTSDGTMKLLYKLHLDERYTGEKYEKLKLFLTGEYLSSHRSTWFFKVNDEFIQLVKAIHKYVGQEFIDNLMIKMELDFDYNNILTGYSHLCMYLELTSKHTNLARFIKDLIRKLANNKEMVHYYLYMFYELKELSDNYEILIHIISKAVLSHRKYFNSQTIADMIHRNDVKDPYKIFEVYEYAYNQGYITKSDLTYINKCIVTNSL